MSKPAAILTILVVVIICFFGFRLLKDSYKILPINQKQPTNIDAFHFEKWHEFTSPQGEFKVLFPSLPQHATESIEDPKTKEKRKYDVFVSEQEDGTIYMISLIKYPEHISVADEESMLTQMMNDMVASNPKNKLNMTEPGEYKGHPSLIFSIGNNEMTVDAKAFMAGDKLYILTRIAKTQNYTRDEFLFFINSFELTPS